MSVSVEPSIIHAPADQDPLAGLVDGAAAGDDGMMRGILAAVTPAVQTVVRIILGPDHPELADVVQEGLMALRGALRFFRRESSVVQYARQVAARKAMTARRRWRSQQRTLAKLRREVDLDSEVGVPVDPIVRTRRAAAFRALLDDLPDVQAETFILRVLLDYPLPEVASATGVSINTVRSRVRLAKEKMRLRIQTDASLHDTLREGDS
ncbi:MAG TPA: sigma-70 family RNA polymerase sigma factor [Polyangia bacterium]|jgi:RNA polymerase sigma-70 factor (ECF subfamily)|nr:sigma-70 family RNA polymerase sigma factor [Polyangia bacterium]